MNGSQRFLSRRYIDVSSLVSQRMQIPHHRLGAFVEYVRIDLGRRNIGMAEQVLYDTKIGAVLQEMAGEGMAERVGGGLRGGGGGRPAPAATLRSRPKAWRVRWPLSLSAGKSQGLLASPGACASSASR